MEEHMRTTNPWKGLQSYQENDIIYGRDEEISQLYTRILYNIQTVVYGKSGIGKSSIINAGIIPRAKLDNMLPVSIRLAHTTKKNQTATDSYVHQIKSRIEEELKKIGGELEEIVPHQEGHEETLWELLHRHRLWIGEGEMRKPVIPLLLFDQFEEIFTLEINHQRVDEFFSQLTDLLNEIKPEYIEEIEQAIRGGDISMEEGQSKIRARNVFSKIATKQRDDVPDYLERSEFHLVITLREDFLSYLERCTTYIPAMKQNRYALLPLNEEQAAKIIMEPVKGLVDMDVATEIIHRVTGKNDFKLDGIPEIEVDAALLSLYMEQLYKKKREEDDIISSEMVIQYSDDIIKSFYEESIKDIPEEIIEYLEDELITNENRRNNVARGDLIIGGVSEDVLDRLIDKKVLRQFSYGGDLRIEFIHDILCPVVNERIEDREQIEREREEKKRQEEETQHLLEAEERKRKEIERKAAEEQERLKEEARKQRRKNRIRFQVVMCLMTFIVLAWAYWFFLVDRDFGVCYASFTTKNGWPVGIGKVLDEEDKRELPLYYELVRKGYFNRKHPYRVRVMNSEGHLSFNRFQESPLVRMFEVEGSDNRAKAFANLQHHTAYWEFIPDHEGNVARKTAFSIDGEELYSVQFFRSSIRSDENNPNMDSSVKHFWANYTDKDGKSLHIRDNGADRIRITVNASTGFYECFQFFSESGTPQPNQEEQFGIRYQLAEDGRILRMVFLDAFGDPINEADITFESFDKYGRWYKSSRGYAKYSKNWVKYIMNNRTDYLKFDDQGELEQHIESTGSSFCCYYYDKGLVKEEMRSQIINGDTIEKYHRTVLPQTSNDLKITIVYRADSLKPYRKKIEGGQKGKAYIEYYCGDNSDRINEPLMVTMHEGTYHRMVIDTTVLEDGYVKVSRTLFDENRQLSNFCKVDSDVAYYNNRHEMRKHVQYKKGQILHSYLNEYENGLIVAQSVMDEDSQPIRYPGWDKRNLCYYKLKLVYDFYKNRVAIKGINEFGEESLITSGDYVYSITPQPSSLMKEGSDNDSIFGIQVYKKSLTPVDHNRQVNYIHITDTLGTWYKAGLRNGDLLVHEYDEIVIARPNVPQNAYDILRFSPKQGQKGAEHYPVYFTEKEMNRYNNAIYLNY